MSMVDDLAIFNAYPWGNEVFDMTFNSLSTKNLVAKYQDRLKKSKEKQVSVVKETYTPICVSGSLL